MDPTTLFLPTKTAFVVASTGQLTPEGWRFCVDIQTGLATIDLSSQVVGILPRDNGGTGIVSTATFPAAGLITTTTSPLTAVQLTVSSGVTANSGGIKHGRVTTGAIPAGTDVLVTLTWATAFANANYTPVASVLDSTASAAALSVIHIEVITAAAVSVRVFNNSAGALTGTLLVVALHD